MIPDEIADSPLAEVAAKAARLHAASRAANVELQRLTRELPVAERRDIQAAGQADAAGKKRPNPITPEVTANLQAAKREAGICANAYAIATAEFGDALGTDGRAWRETLDADIRTAGDEVEARTLALAETTAALTKARRVRAWLDFAVKHYRTRGAIPTHFTHNLPRVEFGGGSAYESDAVLAALIHWTADDDATTDRTWDTTPEPHPSILERDAAIAEENAIAGVHAL